MNEEIKRYIENYPAEIRDLYMKLRTIIYDSVSQKIEEKMWAKIPIYYVNDSFMRFILFKDHINIEARAVVEHKDQFDGYKITPKGMLQLYLNQEIPYDMIRQVCVDTLGR